MTEIRADLERMLTQVDLRAARLSEDADLAQNQAARQAIERELAAIEAQLSEHSALVDSYAPGRGFVAAFDAPLTAGQRDRVLAVMSADQANAVSSWLGPERFRQLAGAGDQALQSALHVHAQVEPLLSDAAAAAGLHRLVGEAPGTRMGIEPIMEVLTGVPQEHLADLLRVIGREDWTHPHQLGVRRLLELGRSPDTMRFILRYGKETYDDLRRHDRAFALLLERLRGLDDAAAADLVRRVREAGTERRREQELGLQRPPARRGGGTGGEVEQRYVDEATDFVTARQDLLGTGTGPPAPEALQAAIDAYARILQIRDRTTGSWQRLQRTHDVTQRQRILQQIDTIGRQGGLPQVWINNARGRVAEALFAPGGGADQRTLRNPRHPAASGGPGYTRLDGVYQPGERPGSNSPVAEWVEVKSTELGLGRQGRPSAEGVAAARLYAAEGRQDWDALQDNADTRGDRIVIHFTQVPDGGTQRAMLDVLFAPGSPFTAVAFGDQWHERPADRPLPPLPEPLQPAQPVGAPTGAAADEP